MLKKNLKNNSTKTGTGRSDKENSLEYYNSILLEEIRYSMKTVIETVQASQTSNDQRFTDLEKKMDNRFEIVETAIRHNSQDIKILKTDVKEIRVEMQQMENRLSEKIDGIGNRVDNHEVRIVNLETARL